MGKIVFQYFEPELVELNEETAKHPDLMRRLAAQSDKDIYVMISEVAAHCGILLNDTYTHENILALCKRLKEELYKKRTGFVFIH
jgi:1-aminocyclopropane-1-carboxylate deaminase/D-cysteine desulfhydrase-like pyridoxal-dependent ACC family enzyme